VTSPDSVPSHVRQALATYDALVEAVRPEVRDAWERLTYRQVLAVHVRLGDAAERLCTDCLESFPGTTSASEARAWIAGAVGRPRERIVAKTREQRVALAVELWLARHEARR
jgi:hypothetical protein